MCVISPLVYYYMWNNIGVVSLINSSSRKPHLQLVLQCNIFLVYYILTSKGTDT